MSLNSIKVNNTQVASVDKQLSYNNNLITNESVTETVSYINTFVHGLSKSPIICPGWIDGTSIYDYHDGSSHIVLKVNPGDVLQFKASSLDIAAICLVKTYDYIKTYNKQQY